MFFVFLTNYILQGWSSLYITPNEVLPLNFFLNQTKLTHQMANKHLLLPIEIAGAYLSQPTHCSEPRLNFSDLPYFDGEQDVNGHIAYLGQSIQSVPFKNRDFDLPAGVHLHWALPEMLTKNFRYPLLELDSLQQFKNHRSLLSYLIEYDWIAEIEGQSVYASIIQPLKHYDFLIKELISERGERIVKKEEISKLKQLFSPGNTIFPPTPNRWLVTRFSKKNPGSPDQQWMVESDFMHPHGQNHSKTSVSYPVPKENRTDPPFRWIGRKIELEDWAKEKRNSINYLPKPLTAIGYGDATFAGFYPNCHSVFGFHDDCKEKIKEKDKDGKEVNKVVDLNPLDFTYEVMGFYEHPDNNVDFLHLLSANFAHRYGNQDNANIADDYKRFLEQEYRIKFPENFNHQNSMDAFPKRMICFGQFTVEPFKDEKPIWKPEDFTIAMGHSGTEALSAFLNHQLLYRPDPEREREKEREKKKGKKEERKNISNDRQENEIEEFLEALKFSSKLEHLETDIGPKFQRARHESGFVPEHGGTIWTIRPDTPNDGNEKNGEQITLPEETAHFLNELNELQQDRDRAAWHVESIQKQIYANWNKYMITQYPPEGSEDEFPDIDKIRFYLEQYEINKLNWWQKLQKDRETEILEKIEGYWLFKPEEFDNWDELIKSLSERLLGNLKDQFRRIDQRSLLEFLNRLIKTPDLENSVIKDQVSESFKVRYQRNEREPLEYLRYNRLLLESLHPDLPRHDRSVLQVKAASRFWRPTDPVVLLAADGLKAAPKLASAGLLDWAVVESNIPLITEENYATLHNAIETFNGQHPDHFAFDGDRKQHPIMLDWLVAFYPTADHQPKTKESEAAEYNEGELKNYSPDYLHNNFDLPLHQMDLVSKAVNFSEEGQNFWGSSILSPHAGKTLQEDLEEFCWPLLISLEEYYRNLIDDINDEFSKEQFESLFENVFDIFKNPQQQTPEGFTKLHLWYFEKLPEKWLKDFLNREPDSAKKESSNSKFVHDLLNWENDSLIEGYPFDLWEAKHLTLALIAHETLNESNYLSQSLGGFADALLMLRLSHQLDIDDPLGFPVYSEFTQKIKEIVDGTCETSVLPNNAFFPITAGSFSLLEIRILDTFGREIIHVKNLQDTEVITSTPLQSVDKDRYHVTYPPRFAQATRLDFNWLSAENDELELNAHPASSPICGWVLLNKLDNSLMIYNGQGKGLGYIDVEGKWRVFPGQDGPVLPAGIPNWHLRRMVIWLIGKAIEGDFNHDGHSDTIKNFISLIEEAVEKIEPERMEQYGDGIAMLMSRPLALVRAFAKLELKGTPAENQSWIQMEHMIQDPNRFKLSSHGIETLKVPLRLGEDHQLNDGLVGFWEDAEDGESYEDDAFKIPSLSRTSTGNAEERNHPIIDSLSVGTEGFDGKGIRFNMLIDPHGSVHATCGILPVKELFLPVDQYQQVLKSIEITFLTAYVLTAKELVNISLPEEQGFGWSFISRKNNAWTELTTVGHFRLKDLEEEFGDLARLLWSDLQSKNWITVNVDGEATILPDSKRAAPQGQQPFPSPEIAPQLELFLASRMIGNFSMSTAYQGPQEIRDGWLKLRTLNEEKEVE